MSHCAQQKASLTHRTSQTQQAASAGLAHMVCPALYWTRCIVCPCRGLQDCRECLDGQSGWGSFGHIQMAPACPWPDSLG